MLLPVLTEPPHKHRGIGPCDGDGFDDSRLDMGDLELEPRSHGDGLASVAAPARSAHLIDREPERRAAFCTCTVRTLDVPPDEVVATVLAQPASVPCSDEQPAFSDTLDVDDHRAVVLIGAGSEAPGVPEVAVGMQSRGVDHAPAFPPPDKAAGYARLTPKLNVLADRYSHRHPYRRRDVRC